MGALYPTRAYGVGAISSKGNLLALRRYAEMCHLFGRNLDFNPASAKPRLLMLSTLGDRNGALSAYRWMLSEIISHSSSEILKIYNVQYRLVEDVSELCKALRETVTDAVMIAAHGSSDCIELGRETLSRWNLPQNCFSRVKDLFLYSCETAAGTDSIAAAISERMPGGRVVAPAVAVWDFKLNNPEKTPPIEFAGPSLTETRTFANRRCFSTNYLEPPCYNPHQVAVQIDPPPSPLVEIAHQAFGGYCQTIIFASDIAFYAQMGALALEQSPHIMRAISFLSRNLLLKPLLYCAYPCGLSRETRGRILQIEQAAEERACTGLRVASEKISPLLRTSARFLDKYIVFPLISAPLKIGALMGTLWCNGVNAIFSYIPKTESRIYRISGTVFFHAVKSPGYILCEVGDLALKFLIHV